MILDTTFLLDVRHADTEAVSCARDLEASPEPLRVSAITLAELQAGVPQVGSSLEEYSEIVDVTATKEIVPVTKSIARRGGRFHGELLADGTSVGLDDCLIAATAVEFEEPVVTRNVRHFERIDGVLVREY
ncbi:PIN domain-containing protein [Haladaptatus sp. DYF46]|uniref:PIN domain-containing protein n=1 Tax=Haladaptatus sp. DYF46 TaxID=2886041 RepID=UPI001E3FDD61